MRGFALVAAAWWIGNLPVYAAPPSAAPPSSWEGADAVPANSEADVAAEADSLRFRRASVSEAADLLSRYPAGRVPAEVPVLRAISQIEMAGTPAELSLLAHLRDREQPAVAAAAERAMQAIEDRRRESDRQRFALLLPDERDLDIDAWRRRGLGPAEASCAAYAERVLAGADPAADPAHAVANGQVRAALAGWARLAAAGDTDARDSLIAWGVDAERLLVGLLHARELADARPVETLIRHGERWTVRVFAERSRTGAASDQATAADALGRMLDVSYRHVPLAARDRDLARRALAAASQHAAPAVRPIALEALQAARGVPAP